MSSSPTTHPALPSDFYIFVSEAGFSTRHNFAITGKFVSAGFGAAHQSEIPTGTVTAWSPGSEAPRDEADIRAAYESGSLDYLPFDANPYFVGWPTPFTASISNNYRVEYDAEVGRRHFNSLLPSRLSAIYAFGDYASCEEAHHRHGWPLTEVRRFRLADHPSNRVVRVNMEIVSLARQAYARASWTAADLDWLWRSYWFGGGNIGLELPIDGVNFERVESGVLWEYLVEGVLEVL